MSRVASLSFVARFAIVSAVLLGVAGLVLAQMLTAMMVARAEDQAAQTGAATVRLGIATRLDARDFDRVIDAKRARALDSLLQTAKREGRNQSDEGYTQAACLVAQRLLDQLHRPFTVRGVGLAVEASIGIACFPEHGEDHGSLLQHADVAMYVAKQSRGAYAVYDPAADESSLSRITLLDELRGALERDELVLYYQPKVELCDGTVRSVEALLRWNHPTRGTVPPNDFIPVAEQTGLISALTETVLRKALRQARVWKDEGRDISVSVNLSARNLTDTRLPQLVKELLAQEDVEPNRLEVEVTETSAMADPARAADVLRKLSQLGVAVSVDDYGTGYSSLSYLRSLPIGTLKIDQSFVVDMLSNAENAVIVRSTIELAHNLGLKVVGEGVEDVETREALAELGCHVAQGFHLSRPLPAAALAPLLDRLAPPSTTERETAPRRDAILGPNLSGSLA